MEDTLAVPAAASPSPVESFPSPRSSRSPTRSSRKSSRSRGDSSNSTGSSSRRKKKNAAAAAAAADDEEAGAAAATASPSPARALLLAGTAAAAGGRRRRKAADEEYGEYDEYQEFDEKVSKKVPAARIVLQRVDAASLTVSTPPQPCPAFLDDFPPLPGCFQASIGKGLIAYVCFLRGATDETVAKMAALLFGVDALNMPDTDPSLNRKTSLSQYTGNIGMLVVPQASLAGKLKNSVLQYHSLVEKSVGERLYALLIDTLQRKAKEEERRFQYRRQICVYAGTYGALQRLTLSTPGPFTSFFEIEN